MPSPEARETHIKPLVQKWIALAEIVLANLAWIDELDIEGWFIATVLAVAAGAAIWLLVGPWWLVAAASGYLLLLVGVRLTVGRQRRRKGA
jgi:hypothetical protein